MPWTQNQSTVITMVGVTSRLRSKPPSMSEMASLEKSRNSPQTGGCRRASFHASLWPESGHADLVTEIGSEMNCKSLQTVRILSFQALPSGCIIDFLKQNPPMRQHFLNWIAGPSVNKMFECGMIP
jgi:hypothetical protein